MLAAAALLGLQLAGCDRGAQSVDQPLAVQTPAAATSPTPASVESTGLILGVGIGTPITEARAKLDPLRAPGEHEPDRKEEAGKRIYWKLTGTDYDWIIVWANSDGLITRLRANPLPDRPKPFAEVGDLSRAVVNEPLQAIWTVERPGGISFRLVAQGNDQLARTIYMFALGLEMR